LGFAERHIHTQSTQKEDRMFGSSLCPRPTYVVGGVLLVAGLDEDVEGAVTHVVVHRALHRVLCTP
jgi:hypothetical protein